MFNDNLVAAIASFSAQYDGLMHSVSREISQYGFAPAEGRIMQSLHGCPSTQADLRKVTQIERGQLSRAIKSLMTKGLIEISLTTQSPWPAYKLTDRGWQQLTLVERARYDAISRLLGQMLRPERKAFVDALANLGKLNFVDPDTDEPERWRTAYPGEVSQIISNALDFYRGPFPFKFNSQIEGYVLRQFAEVCDRAHHHIIVYERYGYVVGSILLLVDQSKASARLDGLWGAIGFTNMESAAGMVKLALQRAASAGCINITAHIPNNIAWPNVFRTLGWTFATKEPQKIAGAELEIETWVKQL